MNFKDWLKLIETMTSAGMVAPYSLPIFGHVSRRMYSEPIVMSFDDGQKKRKKKKKKKKHQDHS